MKYIKYFEKTDKDKFRGELLWDYMIDECSVKEYIRFLNDNVDFINRMVKKNQFIFDFILRFAISNNYKHIFVRNNDLLIKITTLLDLVNKYKFEDIKTTIYFIKPQYFLDSNENIIVRKEFFEKLILYLINKFPDTIKILNNLDITDFYGKKINLEEINNLKYDLNLNFDINIKFAELLMNSEISKYLDEETITKFTDDIDYINIHRGMKKYNI